VQGRRHKLDEVFTSYSSVLKMTQKPKTLQGAEPADLPVEQANRFEFMTTTPMRRTRMKSPCCARAATGHSAAALESRVMISRRFIR
jgi:hypothetical protein